MKYEVQFVLWKRLAAPLCSPLHPFEFTHILLLIFIALALEHSNFYSRHFIEDRKSLESSYVFFLKWFCLEIFDVSALHS